MVGYALTDYCSASVFSSTITATTTNELPVSLSDSVAWIATFNRLLFVIAAVQSKQTTPPLTGGVFFVSLISLR